MTDKSRITRGSWLKLLNHLHPGEDFADALGKAEDVEAFKADPPPPLTEAEKAKTKKRADNGLDTVRADEVVQQNIDWIWDGHLAQGQHTCIAGVQGDGKSQLVYKLAAAVTTGGNWPSTEQKAPLGNVIVLNAEDTVADVLAPRLAAAGCDMKRVYIVKAVRDKGRKRKFNLQADLDKLAKLAATIGDVKLITFDPVSSYLGGDLDSHHNTALRDALDPITAMAEKTGAAVVSVTHFNKATKGVSALNRVMGGAGFTAAPRAAFAVIRDAKDKSKRMMLSLKGNLAAEGSAYGMIFHIETKEVGTDKRNDKPIVAPFIAWDGTTDMTADEALAATLETKKAETGALAEAKQFLIDMLDNAPMLSKDVKAEAADYGIAPETLRRAREDLDIICRKRADKFGKGPWLWSLPDELRDLSFLDLPSDAVECLT